MEMENKELKIIGGVVAAVALLGGAFLVGSMFSGGGKTSAEPELEPTAVVEAVNDEDKDDESIVLVGDPQGDTEEKEGENQNQNQGQGTVEPIDNSGDEGGKAVAPPPAPVEPTPAPPVVEPTPAPPTPEPTPVNEAPYVVSISPDDDEDGVAINSAIVVTFSEPMDKASVQSAFNLSTGLCGAFNWNGSDTVMTYSPCGNFAYGTDVEVEVYDSASDKEGLGMDDEFDSEFKVLQQSTIQLRSEDAYDGFVYGPGVAVLGDKAIADGQYITIGTWSRGFLSFDLDDLPADLVEIQTATVNVKQNSHQPGAYTASTGPLFIESVTYGALTIGDWGMTANTIDCGWIFCLVPTLSSDAANGWKTANVVGYVRADWEHREDRDYNSQFRLRFSNDCGDGSCGSVSAKFNSGEGNGVLRPYLSITYTHP